MHYVYLLMSPKTDHLYIGQTSNVVRRLAEHNSGKVFSTKSDLPWRLVYLEGYFSEDDAKHREYVLKQYGRVYSQLKRRIVKSITKHRELWG